MDKYVGEAERNIRDLFVSAEEEWEAKGAESELHVVIPYLFSRLQDT